MTLAAGPYLVSGEGSAFWGLVLIVVFVVAPLLVGFGWRLWDRRVQHQEVAAKASDDGPVPTARV